MVVMRGNENRRNEMTTLDTLATTAAEIAMRGFADYIADCISQGFEVVDYEAACEILKRHVKERLPEALDDAKEAFDAHMDTIGCETFAASLRRAGIDAAKEFTQEK
jgi:hypothetical protein